jgi:hypothetical protein
MEVRDMSRSMTGALGGFAALALGACLLGLPAPAGAAAAPEQVAQAKGNEVDVTVDAQCAEGFAVFKIVNKGFEWPTVGKFSIYRVSGQQLVSQRRMRLGNNQIASFKVKATPGVPTELGIHIEPEWYQRTFAYDAKVTC